MYIDQLQRLWTKFWHIGAKRLAIVFLDMVSRRVRIASVQFMSMTWVGRMTASLEEYDLKYDQHVKELFAEDNSEDEQSDSEVLMDMQGWKA